VTHASSQSVSTCFSDQIPVIPFVKVDIIFVTQLHGESRHHLPGRQARETSPYQAGQAGQTVDLSRRECYEGKGQSQASEGPWEDFNTQGQVPAVDAQVHSVKVQEGEEGTTSQGCQAAEEKLQVSFCSRELVPIPVSVPYYLGPFGTSTVTNPIGSVQYHTGTPCLTCTGTGQGCGSGSVKDPDPKLFCKSDQDPDP